MVTTAPLDLDAVWRVSALGPNVRRLAARFAAVRAIPAGGGVAAGLAILADPKKLADNFRAGLGDAQVAIAAVKAAPDNTLGSDDEVIAAELLRLAAERDRAARR